MTFLVVLCEGETEADFVEQILSPHLELMGIRSHPELLAKKIKHDVPDAPGGVLKYSPVIRHINAALRQFSAPTSHVTTMIDFYAFPRDFPNYEELAKERNSGKRVALFEQEMYTHAGRDERFIPNIQLHEFEALIYSNLNVLRTEFAGSDLLLGHLDSLIASVNGIPPEEINQTPDGAPSKRLIARLPYRKRRMANRTVRQIGLEHVRLECPHFAAWITRLEQLGSKAS
jgi:hypothetical protein